MAKRKAKGKEKGNAKRNARGKSKAKRSSSSSSSSSISTGGAGAGPPLLTLRDVPRELAQEIRSGIRADAETARPENTKKSYKGQLKEFDAWASADPGTEVKGFVKTVKYVFDNIVSQDKVMAYLKTHLTQRGVCNNKGVPVVPHRKLKPEAVRQAVKALKDLQQKQRTDPATREAMVGVADLTIGNQALKQLQSTGLRQQAAQSRENYEPRGEKKHRVTYTMAEHRQMCQFGLFDDSLRPRTNSVVTSAAVRVGHVMGHGLFKRGDGQRSIMPADYFLKPCRETEGTQTCELLCIGCDGSKTNQTGEWSYAADPSSEEDGSSSSSSVGRPFFDASV